MDFYNRPGYLVRFEFDVTWSPILKLCGKCSLIAYFCTCKPCEKMHEIYREYQEHGSLHFLIIVFKDEKEYLLKIFLHKIAVRQFPIDAPKADMSGDAPVTSFERHIKIAREWVLANY